MELKPGTRLRSATDTTEVVVVRSPAGDVDLRCGGKPMASFEAEVGELAAIQDGFASGTFVGKRYGDEALGLEALCTKPGPASLSIGARILEAKGAKALPSSD